MLARDIGITSTFRDTLIVRILRTNIPGRVKTSAELVEYAKTLGVRTDVLEEAVLIHKLHGNPFTDTFLTFNFKTDTRTKELFRSKCEERGSTISKILNSALYRYLKQDQELEDYPRRRDSSVVVNCRPNQAIIEALKIRAKANLKTHPELCNNILGAVIEDHPMFRNMKIITKSMMEVNSDAFFLGASRAK